MKEFTYWDYPTTCPLATKVENAVNDCGSAKSHYEDIKAIFADRDEFDLTRFINACVAYWSKAKSYDARNKYAVLHSRKIVEEYPIIKEGCEHFSEELLREAYGFTHSAHRYLQNEFFKTILYKWESENFDVSRWLKGKEFVYNEDNTDLVPYAEIKAKRGW